MTTRRQQEVLDHLIDHGAISSATARITPSGSDNPIAEMLARLGVLNKRYDRDRGEVYWIRAKSEPKTGVNIPAGFILILEGREVTTQTGRKENFFLARARYDGKGTTFRRLLRGWLQKLGLRNKDVLSGTWAVQLVPDDDPVFQGDHVIVNEL